MTSKPITRLQKYDSTGGCKAIDEEFSLPACTSSDLISSEEFKRLARKFRKEYSVYRYGREDGGEVETPFPESDRESAALIWNARPDVRDLFESADGKLRRDRALGERVAWTLLQLQTRGLSKVKTPGGIVNLQIASLSHKQRGEWLTTVLEYPMYLRTRSPIF
ncbi:hypothetical protein DL766_008394 [Monosporascus sp. MC13-8B]|uniref:Uncharacterized protein n=1 Tax=Monosporascus cannonballus TaxID=155416 RepID=A0ABY0HAJ7_9PEZI|nr:hypothetical protein DL763_010349 [Monosporascus cannonballus]RYO89005.1 hypothetical protein DL762_003435 [Monosporascus cannonballus]RYP19616.1 hypothetical protein DL766_008394 [Monosporascus sp. MC13-8B]